MKRWDSWTPAMIDRLEEAYNEGGVKAAIAAFPTRTPAAVKYQLTFWGIKGYRRKQAA